MSYVKPSLLMAIGWLGSGWVAAHAAEPNRLPSTSAIGVESIPAAPPGSTPESIPVEEVLERVKRTGELVAGTRTDAMPFAYRDADDRWQGYSIDLLERVRSQMQQHLQRPVELKLVPVDSTNRMNMVMAGSVDLVCGATSYSRRRELDVNFSVGYFVTGTQLLINTRSQLGAEFHIGVVAGTTNQSVMAKLFPIAQFSQFENRGNGLAALQRGQIDGLASDGILLQAMRQALPESERLNYQIFPAQQSYDQEKYACILPEGQPEFRKTVNAALMRFMQEAVTGAPQATATLDRWFGEQGVVPIDRQPLLNFFQQQLTAYVPSQPPNWPAFANSTPFDPSLNSTPTQSQAVDRTRDQAANLYTFPIFD